MEALPLLQNCGDVVGLTRSELDLTDAAAIRSIVRRLKPSWIVNAAAYTAVDKAESDARAAYAINGDAPGILGEEAALVGAPVIHFSTDYVFAGTGEKPWREDDFTGPLSVYGASKLAGERALSESGAVHFIFRTSWVFGTTGESFLQRILKLALEREELKIVDDQVGSPTWSRDLARLVVHCIQREEAEGQRTGTPVAETARPVSGIYHACGTEFTTWFGFASEFVRLAQKAHPERKYARLIPVPSTAYATAAQRPANSRMNCEKLTRTLGFEMPSWQDSTAAVMDEMNSLTPR